MQNENKEDMLKAIYDIVVIIEKRVEILEEKIPQMQKDIRDISRAVAVIEVEHGEKLDILFDAFGYHSERIDTNKKSIAECMKIVERHSSEIYCLKTK